MAEERQVVRRRYTAEERVNALTVLAACGGVVSEASKATGVPARTLEYWRDRPANGSTRATLAVREELLAQSLERTVWRLGRAIKGKIGDAKLGQAASALSLIFDRWRALRDRGNSSAGMAGANGGLDLSTLSLEELRSFKALVAKASGGAVADLAPGDVGEALPAEWSEVPASVAATALLSAESDAEDACTQTETGEVGVPGEGGVGAAPHVSGSTRSEDLGL